MPSLYELLQAPDNAMNRAKQRLAGQEVAPVSPEEQAVHSASLASVMGSMQPSREIAKDVFRIGSGKIQLSGPSRPIGVRPSAIRTLPRK